MKGYQANELTKLREGDKHRENPKYDGRAEYKMQADNMDAFMAMVLSEHDAHDPAMTDYLYRDRDDLTVYGLSLTGLVLHKQQDVERREMVIKNIEQFLEQDEENQTAWLRLPESSWWYWYGSDNEAMAVYLKLLVAVRPNDEIASRLVKYLLNNRKHGTYWNSTRDTAMVVESMADYIKATGEDQPDMTVEILIDGEVQKTVKINSDNLFSFDNVLLLEGEAVTVLVVLDACDDGSGAVVRACRPAFAAAGVALGCIELSERRVGAGRAAGARTLLGLGARWLAFTDADTRVSPQWLAAQLALDADVVCGSVAVDDWSPHAGRADALRDHFAGFYQDRDGHRHIHGANLGVSAAAYQAAGGFESVPCHEDVLLVRALSGADFPGYAYFLGSLSGAALWPVLTRLLKLPQRPRPDPDRV